MLSSLGFGVRARERDRENGERARPGGRKEAEGREEVEHDLVFARLGSRRGSGWRGAAASDRATEVATEDRGGRRPGENSTEPPAFHFSW